MLAIEMRCSSLTTFSNIEVQVPLGTPFIMQQAPLGPPSSCNKIQSPSESLHHVIRLSTPGERLHDVMKFRLPLGTPSLCNNVESPSEPLHYVRASQNPKPYISKPLQHVSPAVGQEQHNGLPPSNALYLSLGNGISTLLLVWGEKEHVLFWCDMQGPLLRGTNQSTREKRPRVTRGAPGGLGGRQHTR